MSEPFIGEIQAFGFNYAPRGWALCNGQLLPIAQNTALFSLLGTTYGGDGRTTFALPDLRGRVPVHSGNNSPGPGLTPRPLGQRSGTETTTLNTAQMPSHNHTSKASANPANTSDPIDNNLAMAPIYNDGAATVNLDAASTGNTGSSQAHDNMQPYLAINFCIALTGLFPSRP